ncbi:MAG: TonB-dependent receptor [Granulosicoccaceae bacterium]
MFRLTTIALLISASAAADTLAPVLVEAELDGDSAEQQIGDVVLEEYTGSHQRIEREQLLQAGAELGELLSHETGVQHSQAGAEGSYSSVTIRGASSAQSPIYWDGMLLNGAANPSIDLSDLELLNLDTVDIYRGSAPVQLGAGGIGGAVELRSPRQQGISQRARLQWGSFGARALQLGASWGDGRWHADSVFSHRQADNDFSFVNDNGTPLNAEDDERQRRHNAQFERLSVISKLNYHASPDREFDISLQANHREQGVPEWSNLAGNQASYETKNVYLQAQQRRTAIWGGNWSNRFGLYGQWRNERYDDQLSQVGLGAQLTESDSRSTGVIAYLEHIGTVGTAAVHLDARHETLDSDDSIDNKQSQARRDNLALTGQYSWFSEDERWLLTPALKLNALKDTYKGQLRDGSDKRSGQSAGLQFGVKLTSSALTTWQANIGQHHREPSFFELFGDQGLYIGNEELIAEKGFNLDVSWHRKFDKGSVQLGLFHSDRQDLIATVFSSQGVGRSVNIGEATVTGLEIDASYQFNDKLQLSANWTLQDSTNQSPQVAFNGKQLPGQAKNTAYFRASFAIEDAKLWFESSTLRDKYYDSANLLAAQDQLLHNLGATWKFKHWTLDTSLRNISDEATEDFNGFAKPGRSAHLSIAYQFKTP